MLSPRRKASLHGDCWQEWVDVIECRTAAPYECPCDTVACLLNPYDESPVTEGCAAEDEAFRACRDAASDGTVTGDSGSCNYFVNREGCRVTCRESIHFFEASCTGSSGGAQSCTCKLNGVTICDDAVDGCFPWLADDCIGVAERMAAGQCEALVNCCFTWFDGNGERCSCTADPTAAGFDSCEAAAAAGGGEVVDLCPRYEPIRGGFPEPP